MVVGRWGRSSVEGENQAERSFQDRYLDNNCSKGRVVYTSAHSIRIIVFQFDTNYRSAVTLRLYRCESVEVQFRLAI